MILPRVPSSSGALPIGPSLPENGQTIAAGAPELASHLPLALHDRLFTLAGIAGHAHVLAVGELPAMQGVFLHGGDEESAVRARR